MIQGACTGFVSCVTRCGDGEENEMKTTPYPRFVFEKWAYGCGLQVGAQYALEDGYYTPLRAWIERKAGIVIEFLFGWRWWA